MIYLYKFVPSSCYWY